jgi:hypothetical protein
MFFCTRLRLAHRRRAARKKYHLAAPWSNTLAGGQTERRAKDSLMALAIVAAVVDRDGPIRMSQRISRTGRNRLPRPGAARLKPVEQDGP